MHKWKRLLIAINLLVAPAALGGATSINVDTETHTDTAIHTGSAPFAGSGQGMGMGQPRPFGAPPAPVVPSGGTFAFGGSMGGSSGSGSKLPSDCKGSAPLSATEVNPAGLETYLKKNKDAFNDVGEVVCCLPENYRRRVAVVHNSNSAQSSDASAPRVLIFGCDPQVDETCAKPGSTLQSVLSINGGLPGQSQKDSIEMFYYSRNRKVIEMRDLEVHKGGKHHMSEANPALCMNCHGNGASNIAGPKPVFEADDRWERMSMGVFSDCWFNGSEAMFLGRMQRRSVQAMKENPRYKCLDGNNTEENTRILDRKLQELNEARQGRILKAQPDFNSFKYAMAAAALSCKNMPEMFPKQIVPKLSLASLSPTIGKAANLFDECVRNGKEIAASNRAIDKYMQANMDVGAKEPNFVAQRGPFCSSANASPASDEEIAKSVCAPFAQKAKGQVAQLFDRFKLDTMMRSRTNKTTDKTNWWRLMLDGRNQEADQFQMQVTGGSFAARDPGVGMLAEWHGDRDLEPVMNYLIKNKHLNRIRNRAVGTNMENTKPLKEAPEDLCRDLAGLSNKALLAWAETRPTVKGYIAPKDADEAETAKPGTNQNAK